MILCGWFLLQVASAQRPTLDAWAGRTPVLDGVISPGEWDDATRFTGVLNWTHTFTATTDPHDLALTGYVKHDARRLYFAFDVTDDILYGIDIASLTAWAKPQVQHEIDARRFPVVRR